MNFDFHQQIRSKHWTFSWPLGFHLQLHAFRLQMHTPQNESAQIYPGVLLHFSQNSVDLVCSKLLFKIQLLAIYVTHHWKRSTRVNEQTSAWFLICINKYAANVAVRAGVYVHFNYFMYPKSWRQNIKLG